MSAIVLRSRTANITSDSLTGVQSHELVKEPLPDDEHRASATPVFRVEANLTSTRSNGYRLSGHHLLTIRERLPSVSTLYEHPRDRIDGVLVVG